jgi:hypothetical protein
MRKSLKGVCRTLIRITTNSRCHRLCLHILLSCLQVEASYIQQGYHVERNEQFGFLVVSDRANAAAATAAADAGLASSSSSRGTPGWLRNSGGVSSSSSSSDGSTDDELSRSFAINGWQKASNSTVPSGAVQQNLPSYGSSSVAPSTADGTPAAAAAMSGAAAAAVRAAAMQQQLGSFEGVESVEVNVQWGLLHRAPGLRGQRRQPQRRMLQQQQQQSRRSLRQAAAGATCGDRISYNPDYQAGRSAEGTPYGVSMVSTLQQQQQQQHRCICS